MKTYSSTGKISIVTILGAFLIAGCSGTKSEVEPEPAEIPLGEVTAVDTPEEELFAEAKNYYATELYSVARESFKSLAASYALGAYAEFAEIKAADAYFEMNEFETARTMYEDFMKSRPASRSLPYVTMRAGRSFHLSHQGIGRDPQALERALELYDAVIQRYPTSVYADAAKVYRGEVLRNLESSERVVADFYAHRDNQKAVKAREETIARKWSPLLQVGATESGVSMARYIPGMTQEIKPAPALVVPVEAKAGLRSETGPQSSGPKVARVVCKTEPQAQIFFHLSGALPGDRLPPELRRVVSQGGELSFQLPGVTSRGLTVDCLGTGDMTVSNEGVVALKSTRNGALRSLQNPPRILLVLDR